jgi:hypothetical protein
MNIYELHEKFRKYLYIENPHLLDITIASYITKELIGDPLWLFPVATTGYGKSEISKSITALGEECNVKMMDQTTAKAFASGKRGEAPHRQGTVPSAQGQDIGAWLQNKMALLVFPDLANLLSTVEEEKMAVFAVFRTMFDGYIIRDTGYDSPHYSHIHTNILAFSTPALKRDTGIYSLMGTREILYSLPKIRHPELMDEKNITDEQRNELAMDVKRFIGLIGMSPWIDPNEETKTKIKSLAKRIAVWRAEGITDDYGYLIDNVETEVPKRLYVQLTKLWKGLKRMGLEEKDIMNILAEIESGSGNKIRMAIYRLLTLGENEEGEIVEEPRDSTLGAISKELNIGADEIRRQLMILRGLKMVELHAESTVKDLYGVKSRWKGIVGF